MAKKQLEMVFTCPKCQEQALVKADVDSLSLAPEVRSKIAPVGDILVYRISSDEMKQFIIEKARKMVPDVKVEVVTKYCERKRQHRNEPHRSYASLRIAFSHHVLKRHGEDGWFGRVGEGRGNVDIVNSMFSSIIQRYQYNRKDLEEWIKSYKTLEELEEGLGMTEKYIQDLRMYSTPQRIVTPGTKESWIIFNAAAENVIHDMLSVPETNAPDGRIQIQDVYPISRDVVEFLVYVHPYETQLKENPEVRKILSGDQKGGKN